MSKIRMIAFDLDGTLTQHKTHLQSENRQLLDMLSERFKLIMVGAGQCRRIYKQMDEYPIDIIGNYGMQFSRYNKQLGDLEPVFNMQLPCGKDSVEKRITELRQRFGYTDYVGKNVEYHDSGCVTFPLLGTDAKIEEKLAFDPDKKIRRALYPAVKAAFSDYTVFVGGSSSFDFAPFPYNKYYALNKYCLDNGLTHEELVYVGDDYGLGGNDESVYNSDFKFICIDDYRETASKLADFFQLDDLKKLS